VENTIVYPDEKVRKELKVQENGRTDFILTSEDTIFNEIRNKHFNVAGPHLNKQIEDIKRMMSDKNQKTIEELNRFI
jgi:putative sterol carrier protein